MWRGRLESKSSTTRKRPTSPGGGNGEGKKGIRNVPGGRLPTPLDLDAVVPPSKRGKSVIPEFVLVFADAIGKQLHVAELFQWRGRGVGQ